MDKTPAASSPPFTRVLEYGTQNRLAGWRRVVSLLVGLMFVAAGGAVLGGMIGHLLPQYISAQSLVYFSPNTTSTMSRSNALQTTAAQMQSTPFINAQTSPLVANGSLTALDVQGAAVSAEVDRKTDLIRITVTHRNPVVARTIALALERSLSATISPPFSSVAIIQPAAISVAARSIRLTLFCRIAMGFLCVLVVLGFWMRAQRRRGVAR